MSGISPGFDAHVHTFPPTAADVWAVERALQPWLGVLGRSRRRAIAEELRENPDLAAPFTLGVGEAGVMWTSAIGGSQVPWSRVEAVERRRDDVLLRLRRPRGVVRLPRRVAPADAIERFADDAARWARDGGAPLDRPVPDGFDAHRLRYRTDPGDVEAFLALMAGESPEAFGRAWPSWVTLAIGTLAVALSVRTFTGGQPAWAAASLLFGLFVVAVALFPAAVPAINRGMIRRHWRESEAEQAEVALALGRSGILQTDADSRHLTPWSAVRRVVDTPEHTFLFLVRGGVLIVPARAVPDAQALSALRDEVRSWQAANVLPMPRPPEVPLAAPREPGDPFEPPASA